MKHYNNSCLYYCKVSNQTKPGVNPCLTSLHCCSAKLLIWVLSHLLLLAYWSPPSSLLLMILSVTSDTFSASRLLTIPNSLKTARPSAPILISTLQTGSGEFLQSTRRWKWSMMLLGVERTSTRLKCMVKERLEVRAGYLILRMVFSLSRPVVVLGTTWTVGKKL